MNVSHLGRSLLSNIEITCRSCWSCQSCLIFANKSIMVSLVLLIILVSSPSPPPSSFVEHLDSPQFPVRSAPTSGLSSQKCTSNHLRLKTTGFPCHRIAMNWDILGSFLAISGTLFSYQTHHFFHSNPFKSLFMILLNFAVQSSRFSNSPSQKMRNLSGHGHALSWGVSHKAPVSPVLNVNNSLTMHMKVPPSACLRTS